MTGAAASSSAGRALRQPLQAPRQFVSVDPLFPIVDPHGFVEPDSVADRPQIGWRQMPGNEPRRRTHGNDGEIAGIHARTVRLHYLDQDIVRQPHALRGPHHHRQAGKMQRQIGHGSSLRISLMLVQRWLRRFNFVVTH
jgi:hypothetical protein